MVNNKVKTAILILGISLGAIANLVLLKRSHPEKAAPSTSTLSLDSSLLESMVFLQTNDNKQILTWNSLDGFQAARDFYLNELAKHEEQLWQEAQQLFGLHKDTFHNRLKDYCYNFSNKKAKRSQTLSPQTITLVESVISDCGLDPKTVQIIHDPKMTTSPAMATHKTIFINEKAFTTYSPEGVRFIIAHETMHIKHQDGMAHGVLDFLLEEKNIPKDKQKQFVHKFLRFQETRADVEAVLINKQFAKGGTSFFTDLERLFTCSTRKHPKTADRLDLCKTVTALWDSLPQGVQHA